MILTAQQLEELTGHKRVGWQKRQLIHLGIPFKERTNGSLVVLRVHVEGLQTQPEPRRTPRVRLEA